MQISAIDLTIIVIYFGMVLAIGLLAFIDDGRQLAVGVHDSFWIDRDHDLLA